MIVSEQFHDEFKGRLENSQDSVWFMARVLVTSGTPVAIYPHDISPTHAEAALHSDSGDLRILHEGALRRAEVKARDKKFSSAWNWPYRHRKPNQVLLINCRNFDQAVEKPVAVYLLSNDSKAYARIWLDEDCRSTWTMGMVPDKLRGTEELCYFTTLEHATFYSIGENYTSQKVEDVSPYPPGAPPWWIEKED